MDVKIGDVYTHNSDGKVYGVRKIDNGMIVLELLEDSRQHTMTDIFGLDRAYTKKEKQG